MYTLYLLSFSFIQLFKQVNGTDMDGLSGNLKELATNIPHRLCSSKADSTVQQYYYSIRKWINWARTNYVCPFPVKPIHLCLYCSYLVQTGTSKSVMDDVCYGVRSWYSR